MRFLMPGLARFAGCPNLRCRVVGWLALFLSLAALGICTRSLFRRAPAPPSAETTGHKHRDIRLFMIKGYARQARPGSVFFLGDSITEGALLDRNFGAPAVNLGVGAARLDLFIQHSDLFLSGPQPAAIVIAVGANDAKRRDAIQGRHQEFALKWAGGYKNLVRKILAQGIVPILATILPIEKGKPLGDVYFDPILIQRLNQHIRELAAAESVPLVDLYEAFARSDGFIAPGATLDGVHLTTESYQLWTDLLVVTVRRALESLSDVH